MGRGDRPVGAPQICLLIILNSYSLLCSRYRSCYNNTSTRFSNHFTTFFHARWMSFIVSWNACIRHSLVMCLIVCDSLTTVTFFRVTYLHSNIICQPLPWLILIRFSDTQNVLGSSNSGCLAVGLVIIVFGHLDSLQSNLLFPLRTYIKFFLD